MNKKGAILAVIVITGLVLAYLLSSKQEVETKKAVEGLPAPVFELSDLSGKKVSLSEFKDKVVLLNFWATWCETCKEDNKALQKLINAEKDNPRLAVISVLFKDNVRNAEEYMKKNGFTFTVLIDDTKTSMNYGLTGVPETFIISKGILRHKLIGPVQWDAPDVRYVIKKLANGV